MGGIIRISVSVRTELRLKFTEPYFKNYTEGYLKR